MQTLFGTTSMKNVPQHSADGKGNTTMSVVQENRRAMEAQVEKYVALVARTMRLRGLSVIYDVSRRSYTFREILNDDRLRKLTKDESMIASYYLGKRTLTMIEILALGEIGVCSEALFELWNEAQSR